MPSTKDFEKNQKKKKENKHHASASADHSHGEASESSARKRRPSSEMARATAVEDAAETKTEANGHEMKVVDVEEHMQTQDNQSNQTNAHTESDTTPHHTGAATGDQDRVEINFPGSELIRSKFPKSFEVAEAVATDWVKDGKFEGLPLGHPLAQLIAQQGLKNAKNIEKKIVSSPLTEKLAMQALTAAMKGQQMVSEVKNKVDQVKAKVFKK